MQSRIQAKPSNYKTNAGFSITIAVTANIKHIDIPIPRIKGIHQL